MNEVSKARLYALLAQSVEEYIKSATPIVSSNLAEKSQEGYSPATIRNDLKMLDQLGFLHQIHTSGGRVPTERGFMAYVAGAKDQTFAADLINDLCELTHLVERIDRKLQGSGAFPIRNSDYDHVLERRQNIYRLLEIPDLSMSAFYLIIKERIDGRK
jgi:hypothetical protein